MNINFKPFSLNSWVSLINTAGPLSFAFLLVLISGKLFEDKSSHQVISGSLSGIMGIRAILLAIALLIIAKYSKFLLRATNNLTLNLFGIYVIIGFLSIFWSLVPVATAGKSIELLMAFLIVYILSQQNNRNEKLTSLFTLISYAIFLQLTIVLIGFLLGFDGYKEGAAGGLGDIFGFRIIGPFISANGIGYLSTIILILLFTIILNRPYKLVLLLPYILIASITLILSTSRTSLALFLISFMLILFFKKRTLFFTLVIPITLVIVIYLGANLLAFIQGGTADSNFYTLSGRTVLWENALIAINQNLLSGYGFGVGSRVMFVLYPIEGFSETISSAHNGFLEVLSGVGLIGFIPWFFSLIFTMYLAIRSYNSTTELFGLFPILIGVTLMSTGLGGSFNEFIGILLVMLVISHKPSNINNRGCPR